MLAAQLKQLEIYDLGFLELYIYNPVSVGSGALYNILYLNLDQLMVQSAAEPQGHASSLYPAAVPFLCYATLVWGH